MASLPLTMILLAVFGLGDAYVVDRHHVPNNTNPLPQAALVKRDADPADFGWIKRWAAVGDSFTAGIGSGTQLGGIFHNIDDWHCSRYDQSYPMVLNRAFGPAVEDFQFVACSGDRSGDIYTQIQNMDGNLDLVIMTAGGNDLCLASMIKKCVFLPFQGEDACQAVIDKAQENIDTILKPNLKQLLEALNDKMNDNSIVVYNGYAQFFNTDNDDCTNNQNWSMPRFWLVSGLKLTIARRQAFNNLVVQINQAISDVIDDVNANSNFKFKLAMSNWDPWPSQGVVGQMCDPSSSGRYPDDSQPDLQFFKPNTYVEPIIHDELKKRDPAEYERQQAEALAYARRVSGENLYDTLLWKSSDPRAEALHKLNPRAPAPPSCPGDGDFDPTLGLGLPDTFGKNFHPNQAGHVTIASFAVETMMDLRAEILDVAAPACTISDDFKCWQTDGRKAYASDDRMNENYKDFCNNFVKQPPHTVGWSASNTYHQGTPDEHTISLQLSDSVADFDQEQCLDSLSRIINGCDGNDPNNPMDWKFGGRWVRGDYTYEVTPNADYRPFPPIQKTGGTCSGWYHVFWSSYEIYGSGFSDYDYGQKSLLPAIKSCLGLGVTKWHFDYINPPTKEGYEWKATFNTPIWVRSRCFKNNKVVQAAGGGFTNGCAGND